MMAVQPNLGGILTSVSGTMCQIGFSAPECSAFDEDRHLSFFLKVIDSHCRSHNRSSTVPTVFYLV